MVEVSSSRDGGFWRGRGRPVPYEAGEGPEGVEEGVGGRGWWHLCWGKGAGGRRGKEREKSEFGRRASWNRIRREETSEDKGRGGARC